MCTFCGCGEGTHSHEEEHSHHSHSTETSQSRIIQIEQDILGKNNKLAMGNRKYFEGKNILALNFLSSPGSGKTTLLVETIKKLKEKMDISVIEGDQETDVDAARIKETGVSTVQINTGKGCHLDAHMVGHAAEELELKDNSVLFIENVGNLVCPAAFDLGEDFKVVVLSVTEGADKPLKYPDIFKAADLMIINKIDLLPYVDFDVEKCVEYAKRISPDVEVIKLSATSHEGVDKWLDKISSAHKEKLAKKITEMEAKLNALKANIA